MEKGYGFPGSIKVMVTPSADILLRFPLALLPTSAPEPRLLLVLLSTHELTIALAIR